MIVELHEQLTNARTMRPTVIRQRGNTSTAGSGTTRRKRATWKPLNIE